MAPGRAKPEGSRMTANPIKPFLKWAGGKRWLFESGQYSIPKTANRYIEPFLGGGAAFFEARPSNAFLSDANSRLIELYTVIRDHVQDFQMRLRIHAAAHCKNYYY